MHRVFASTGAFIGRPNGRDFRLLKELAPQVKCDGFELMFYSDWYGKENELIAYLRGLGADFPTFHCDKQIGELLAEERFDEAFRLFETNCEVASAIGSKLLVLHLWNGRISDSNIAANFSAYPALTDIAERHCVELTAENVISNGRSPLTLLKMLDEVCPNAKFTYDTKMGQFDLENGEAFSAENRGMWKNLRHMHINDRIGGYRDWTSYRALHIGRGDVDFDFVFAALREIGYRGDFTVEANSFAPDGALNLDELSGSVEKVRQLVRRYLG